MKFTDEDLALFEKIRKQRERERIWRAKQDADLRGEIETLKTTVAELASEIRELWLAVEGDSNMRSNVVPMLHLRGGRDAAA